MAAEVGGGGIVFPPGFRFHPTDEELIVHYLMKKVTSSSPLPAAIIAEVDLYKFNPWDLPAKALFGEGEWFFYSPRDRKYPNGARPNRAAGSGYWKATGTDKPIVAGDGSSSSSQCLGVKKALVFYKGRPPKGVKTDWIMNEYRLIDPAPPAAKSSSAAARSASMRLDDWVLCRVRQKCSLSLQAKEDGHLTASPMSATLMAVKPAPMTTTTMTMRKESAPLHPPPPLMLDGISREYQSIADFLLGSQEEDHGEEIAGNHGAGMFHAIKRTLSYGAGMDDFFSMPPPQPLTPTPAMTKKKKTAMSYGYGGGDYFVSPAADGLEISPAVFDLSDDRIYPHVASLDWF